MSHGNLGFTGRRARPPAEDAGERLAAEWSVEPRLSNTVLLDVLGEEGCPLCLLVQRAADDLLARWLSARRLPETTELQIRRAQGLCAPHAWWLLAGATERNQRGEGLARAMVDVLDAALGALRSYDEDGDAGGLDPTVFKRTVRYAWTRRIARRLVRTGTCPVCLLLKRIQETLGYQLLELLRCPELRASYSARAALCLPHFRWAVDTAPDKDLLDRLVETEQKRLQSLLRDGRNRDWASALAHTTGSGGWMACG
jgi:hypothetical protein